MKLQRRNFILVGLAVVLAGVTILTKQPPSQTPGAQTVDLFGFEERQVQGLTVTVDGRSLVFQRDENQVWQMREPEQTVANDANLAYLVNLLVTGVQGDRPLTVAPAELATYGLEPPYATVEITLDNQETHELVLGSYNFNRTNLYALVDPPADRAAAQELQVSLVPADFEQALNRPLEEWEQPEASPAPSASP